MIIHYTKCFIKSIILIYLFLCLAFSVFGQTSTTPSTDEQILDMFDVSLEDVMNVVMVSASKKAQSALDAPATAYVITKEDIKTKGYQNIIDVLDDIPEVTIQKNSNPEYRNMLSFRGVTGNEKILILMNGFRITPSTGDFYTVGQQFSLVNAKRVEIILGPASALYGIDAFGGIINIITENHEEGEPYQGASISSSTGSFGEQSTFFNAGVTANKVKISLAGHLTTSNEAMLQNAYPIAYSWYNEELAPNGNIVESPNYPTQRTLSYFEENASGSFAGESIDQGFNIESQSYFINADVAVDNFNVGYIRHHERHSTATGVQSRFTTYDGDNFSEMNQDVVYMNHIHTSFDQKWRLQSSIRYSYFEINPESNYISSLSRYQRGYFYAFAKSNKVQELVQYSPRNNFSMTIGANYENLTSLARTGLSTSPFDKSLTSSEQSLYFVGLAGYDPQVANDDFDESKAVDMSLYFLNYQNYGSFLQTQWSPFKKLDITAGSRYDYNTRYGGSINPRLGLVYKPLKKLNVKLLYGEAFLAPSPTKAFMQGGSVLANDGDQKLTDYYRLASPDLEPEKLRSFEASSHWFVTSNFSVAIDAFYTKITNAVDVYAYSLNVNFPGSPEDITSSKWEFSQNFGETNIQGITSKINYLFNWSKHRITFNAAYSYLTGSNKILDYRTDETTTVPYVFYQPKHALKAGIEITHPKYSISLRLIQQGKTYSSIQDEADNYYYHSGYLVLNLAARYHLIDKKAYQIALFVNGKNITDNRYYNLYSGGNEGMMLTPQNPAQITGGLQLTL